MIKRVHFERNRAVAYLLLAPQLLILSLFVLLPAVQAVYRAFRVSDPFSGAGRFVWFDNFSRILGSPEYYQSVLQTVIFSLGTTALSMSVGLMFALLVNRTVRGRGTYRLLVIWPYAIAPVASAALWLFLFHPVYGAVAFMITHGLGWSWNPLLSGTDAMVLVVCAAAWKQVSYNFVFFLAGLQAIPRSLIEAAAIDGAGRVRRFWTITWPLLSPSTFFLLVINIIYALFDTFGIIHALTHGGPSGATNILVYKVYADGFLSLDIGLSAAESVILMIGVVLLVVLQFRFLERRVSYGG